MGTHRSSGRPGERAIGMSRAASQPTRRVALGLLLAVVLTVPATLLPATAASAESSASPAVASSVSLAASPAASSTAGHAAAADDAGRALPPDDPDTGDPAPPDGTPTPAGLDDPAPVPDDSVVEALPPARPGLIPNANALRIAWIGTPADRPADAALLSLQNAINAAPAGSTVSFDPSDYSFTGSVLISKAVTLDSASASTLFSRFTVSGGGLRLADTVAIGVASTGATISVTGSGSFVDDVSLSNPSGVARPTGIQLGANVTQVTIDDFTMDGGGELSSYGINLTTGAATITDPDLRGVATGIFTTAGATTGGIEVVGGSIRPSLTGISLGTASAPRITGTTLDGSSATGTGIDLASSSGARVDAVDVRGFSRSIGTGTTNAAAGPTITDATIVDAGREGIALGATTNPSVIRPRITGTGANQSTGILLLRSTAARIETPIISGTMYGISTNLANAGVGPTITAPRISAFGGITLGSTQGATVTDAVLDAGTWGVTGTGLNLANAGRVTVARLDADGFLYAIGAQSFVDASSDRVDISITDVTATGAPTASSGIYLLGTTNARISDVDAELTGAALVIHQSVGLRAQDIVVRGRTGPTSTSGGVILRAYGSEDVDVDRSSIDGGSYGFFYSDSHGSTITNAVVANVADRALYGRSVTDLDVSASTLTGNGSTGAFVVTEPANGISRDIRVHDNTLTDNAGGIEVLQGTTAVSVERNTVSGQPGFVTAGGAHDLVIADNTIDQGADAVAIRVAPLWEDGAQPGSYSSSDVRVLGNTFRGVGTAVSAGSPDPSTPDAARRALRNPVLVTGNVFPAASTAVEAFPNAVAGEDSAATGGTATPGDLVTWTLIPHNDGPRRAPSGWSITQLLPGSVELVSLGGDGYLVAGLTATALDDLAVGVDGPVLTGVVRVTGAPTGTTSLRNVAYVSPASTRDLDADGFSDLVVERLSPLDVPTLATDTVASSTDNDAEGTWAVGAMPAPAPGPAPGPFPADAGPFGGLSRPGLPGTGSDIPPWLLVSALLTVGGLILGSFARRRRLPRRHRP